MRCNRSRENVSPLLIDDDVVVGEQQDVVGGATPPRISGPVDTRTVNVYDDRPVLLRHSPHRLTVDRRRVNNDELVVVAKR